MSADKRLQQLEESFITLVELARNESERMDTHQSWINLLGEAQANSEAKIAALADAQIRTEENVARLFVAQARTEEALARLAEAQAHTDKRLDALIDIVREGRNGKSQG